MQLVYYRKKVPNFGDDLNAVLWKGLAPDLFDDDPDVGFVGIGTIIGMPCGNLKKLHVFSSGIGNDRPEAWRDKQVEYWCVRGPISTRILGLAEDRAITVTVVARVLSVVGGLSTGGKRIALPALGGARFVLGWEDLELGFDGGLIGRHRG